MTGGPIRVLQFEPGRRYTIHLKDGHQLTGRCAMSAPGEVWLIYQYGTHRVQWAGITRIENHDVRRPR